MRKWVIILITVALIGAIGVLFSQGHSTSPGQKARAVVGQEQRHDEAVMAHRAQEARHLTPQERQQFLASEATRLGRKSEEAEQRALGRSEQEAEGDAEKSLSGR
jgi:hypothetical protein